jgi:RNA polymerase sigma-70 factor (ECF subfamily)
MVVSSISANEVVAGRAMADDLTDRLRTGDVQALAELYDENSRRAFGVAYQVLSDGAAAEDVVHDAFIEFWRASGRLDSRRGRPQSLLLTIVHRRAIDAARQRARRSTAPSIPEQIDEQAANLLDQVELVVEREQIQEALSGLSPDHSRAVQLAYFEQLSQREIAERTGVPLGTVKSRLHHAIAQLRQAFGERGGLR